MFWRADAQDLSFQIKLDDVIAMHGLTFHCECFLFATCLYDALHLFSVWRLYKLQEILKHYFKQVNEISWRLHRLKSKGEPSGTHEKFWFLRKIKKTWPGKKNDTISRTDDLGFRRPLQMFIRSLDKTHQGASFEHSFNAWCRPTGLSLNMLVGEGRVDSITNETSTCLTF